MMEAKRKQQVKKIEQMIDNLYLYRGREVKVRTYSIVEGQVRIINQGGTITFPVERIDEELDEFMPIDDDKMTVSTGDEITKLAKATFQGDNENMGKLEDVLMNNINKLQKGEVDVETSKEINTSVKTMIDMSKQKLKMMAEIRKSKKMGL